MTTVDGSNNTTANDKVFLLSFAETEKYFKSEELRSCTATEYAKNRVYRDNITGSCRWWVRDTINMSTVHYAGFVEDGGGYSYMTEINYGIRPAFWLDLESWPI